MPPIRRQVSPHAARLRRDMTDAERLLWSKVRARSLDGLKFRRQSTIGRYVVDFLCLECRLVVELGGGQHSEEVDRSRSAFLEREGYCVIRFWNNDVLANIEAVLERIVTEARRRPSPQPSPVKNGRGRKDIRDYTNSRPSASLPLLDFACERSRYGESNRPFDAA
jgi:very-short-patch-repair endonuclease